ncbi:C-type lectin domain family 4 member C-like [Limanda limanda]|uniref:C-type lectin domain family 4 member C-like n=1 Tax=Limanda limanda TaxID=27771 RepID=UPI0029C982FB|nr:C-type lectin domain family 4 member C-like [Limanda limanda]
MDEPTYCNINYSETQRPASSRRSGVTWERVVLLVLSVLLAAALTALGVTLHENTQTKKRLQKYQDEAKILTEILSGTEPSKVEQPTKPPSVRDETCPRCEDGWEPHGGKCYFFSWVTSSWNKSRKQCTSMSGDLVVINNREEQPDNWYSDNPDVEDCVRMGEKDGATNLKTWFDKSCRTLQKYICEKPEKA